MNPYLIVIGSVMLAWVGPIHLGRIMAAVNKSGSAVGSFDASTVWFTIGVGLLVGGLVQ